MATSQCLASVSDHSPYPYFDVLQTALPFRPVLESEFRAASAANGDLLVSDSAIPRCNGRKYCHFHCFHQHPILCITDCDMRCSLVASRVHRLQTVRHIGQSISRTCPFNQLLCSVSNIQTRRSFVYSAACVTTSRHPALAIAPEHPAPQRRSVPTAPARFTRRLRGALPTNCTQNIACHQQRAVAGDVGVSAARQLPPGAVHIYWLDPTQVGLNNPLNTCTDRFII